MNAGKRFDSIRTHKATIVAKGITYVALYCTYCAIISTIARTGESMELSTAATSTMYVMFGYTTYFSFSSIKKKIIQPMIDSITTALI